VGAGILMQKWFGHPFFLWLGVFWGVGAAGMNIYKAYKKLAKELEEVANNPRYNRQIKRDDDEEDDA